MSGLSLFISYLCDLFSIFSLIFIVINHYDLIQTEQVFVNKYLLLHIF